MASQVDAVEDLCARLIRFDTTNRGHGQSNGERAAAEFVAEQLTDAGLKPALLERAPQRTNVVAQVSGSEPELDPILVHAHLDVVPADPAEWSVPPFAGEIRDGHVWGRGAVDMKDMCAMVISVVQRWAEQRRGPRRDIVLAFVADEEEHGEYGAHWLVDKHPDLFAGCSAAIGESGGYTVPLRGADGRPVHIYPVGTAERARRT
jgi:acetylornithine deacetylase/succinyl-diaminopimelate desuccinylase-like protein